MRPEAILASLESHAERISPAWRRSAAQLAAAWLALLLIFAGDWAAMAWQWWNSSTYNHILFIPLIFGWLVWQRLPEVLMVEPKYAPWGLVPFGAAILLWVLGSFAAFDLVRQTAVTALLPASALIILGPRAFTAVLFPMAYLLFLVPFGDELVPPLQAITAELTIALVGLSGVPAQINGVFIDTPAGLFEVAEACSGVKFLIAMIALGTLVANIGFRSWRRRSLFMALCVAVPILANGVRAWGTIFAAQYVGAERAAGIDHLIYGWIFFALVIAAVLGISWRFFDRTVAEAMIDPAAIMADPRHDRWAGSGASQARVLIIASALLAGGLAWSSAAKDIAAPIPARVDLPAVPGWSRTDYAPLAPWEPQASGAEHRMLGSYADQSGQRVDVFYALYAAQGDGREAGGFGQGALIPGGDWSWASNGPAVPAGKSERLIYRGSTERLAYTWYRSGQMLTASNMQLKLANIADRVALRPRTTAVLILAAERRDGADPQATLQKFMVSAGPVGPWMDRIGEGR